MFLRRHSLPPLSRAVCLLASPPPCASQHYRKRLSTDFTYWQHNIFALHLLWFDPLVCGLLLLPVRGLGNGELRKVLHHRREQRPKRRVGPVSHVATSFRQGLYARISLLADLLEVHAVLAADAVDDGRELAEGAVGERGEEVVLDLL